jgi:nitrate/TMAO reductase-like tetraheme cytochrome c subunit
MSFIRTLWQRIRALSPRTWAFAAIAAVVVFGVLVGILYAWDYTNSPQFCGLTCHTMPPEYNAWQRSPHARVACVECHLGRDFVGNIFTRKVGDLVHVVRYSSGNFTFPLHAKEMIPARDACEKCHWPGKFSGDRVAELRRYESSEDNLAVTTYLILKTGGGTLREGRGFGIHWHIENEIDFIALEDGNELKQTIPWIQVTDASGKKTVYMDIEKPLTPDQVAKAKRHRMDCIDCHNRISHTFRSPEQALDQALLLRRIDAAIPSIKKKGVEVLSASYKSFDEANRAIDGLNAFYARNYPDYAERNATQVEAATRELKRIYTELVFPTQDLSWNTHPDNIGHKDWPGCFRCHDGKHFTSDNKQAIRLECNVCHTVPEVTKDGGAAPVIALTRPDEPESHLTTTWLIEHRSVFDTSCQACHDTNNAGGKDNSSFCSNSACHGVQWKFAGLNAPNLSKIFPPPVPPKSNPNAPPKQVPHPIGGNPDCQVCHNTAGKIRPMPSDHAGRSNDVCLACHKPAIPPAPSAATKAEPDGPPPMTHETAGRTQCLGCHGSGAPGVTQIPKFHKDYEFGNDKCLVCHKPGTAAKPAPSPTSAPRPTTAPATQPTATPPRPTAAPTSTSAPSAGAPSKIPASHAGRTAGCVACHSSGVGGATKFPDNHAGRTDDSCSACHKNQ